MKQNSRTKYKYFVNTFLKKNPFVNFIKKAGIKRQTKRTKYNHFSAIPKEK